MRACQVEADQEMRNDISSNLLVLEAPVCRSFASPSLLRAKFMITTSSPLESEAQAPRPLGHAHLFCIYIRLQLKLSLTTPVRLHRIRRAEARPTSSPCCPHCSLFQRWAHLCRPCFCCSLSMLVSLRSYKRRHGHSRAKERSLDDGTRLISSRRARVQRVFHSVTRS